MRLRNKKTGEIVEVEPVQPKPLIGLTETPRVEDERSESEGKK